MPGPQGNVHSSPKINLESAAATGARLGNARRGDSAYLCGSFVKSKLEESMRWTGLRCRVGSRYLMRGRMAFSR